LAAKQADRIDEIDSKIIGLMASNRSNTEISRILKIPLSTVQRRTRRLLESGIIFTRCVIDYKRFGFKVGLLHIYMKNGDSSQVAEKIAHIEGILSVSLHIGNSDIVAGYAVRNSGGLLELMAKIKGLSDVNKIVWSEEVRSIEASPPQSISFSRV